MSTPPRTVLVAEPVGAVLSGAECVMPGIDSRAGLGSFGAELRRQRFGESLASLAGRTGIGVLALYQLEQDERVPTVEEEAALVRALVPYGETGQEHALRHAAAVARGQGCPRCSGEE
jgi:hypothetical protein